MLKFAWCAASCLKARESELKRKLWRTGLAAVCVAGALLVFPLVGPAASAQTDFTLTAGALTEPAIAAGGTSASNITVTTANGFNGTITFACTVTPSIQGTVSNPVCTISPPSLSGSGGASATITTTGTTSAVSYTISISGTDASGTVTATPLTLTVLAVTPSFTITVQNAVAPSSVPAGNGAEGVVEVNPLNGYTTPASGGITLYCATITPLVTIPPVCSFSYPTGQTSLTITATTAVTSTITISTFGPVTTGALIPPRRFLGLWLPLPLLGLVGVGMAAGGKRSRKAWALLAMFVMSASLLLLPACGNTGVSTSTPEGVTPANSYTFTIVGVDGNGVVSSNTGTGSTSNTVGLTVTAPVNP